MSGERDFQRRLEVIERGIHALEAITDPSVRAAAQQLVQAVLELHGRGLERLLEIVHASDASDPSIIDQLGRDPMVSPLLLLHSLHPLSLEDRVLEALDHLRPALRAKHAQVELSTVTEGVVRVRLSGGAAEKATVERAILDAAPDAAAIEVEGSHDSTVGFVPIESLRARPARPVAHSACAIGSIRDA
jgi:Fe-S cluster biogenesis protein NfuA